ncbi:nitrite reductase large subunit NirB [Compostibacter hankyongensis]|uniref:nitrite reductase large subunit NirB n=1 Tax=Compostibacter hankyongensis TaxID=1007089 RepID=UPI0031E81CA0
MNTAPGSYRKKLVVIGNGMVGHKFCEKLKEKDRHNEFEITVFGEEPHRAYDRVHLSEYFAGKSVEALYLSEAGWYEAQHIRLHLDDPVVEIDKFKKIVTSSSGISCSYDYLIFATGSSPFVPPIVGSDHFGVFVYRTLEDLELITAYAFKAKKAAVIGGGLLGLEAAKAMLDLDLETHVVEHSPRLMPRQLDETGAFFLQSKLEHLGIRIHLKKETSAIRGKEKVEWIEFADNTQLETDMVVVSAGIRPRDQLARQCGLKTGPRGGILVNEQMQTSDPCIYAIGECALYEGMIYGLVAPGYEMAEVAASRLTGADKSFSPFDMSTKLKLIGIDVASFGDPFGMNTAHSPVIFEDRMREVYKRINVSEDGKKLLGGILVGDTRSYNMLLQTYLNELSLPRDLESILFEGGGGNKQAGVLALPDTALVCSCESVSKGVICGAVASQGVTDVEGMKKCTRAGTGCGGCIPMVKDLIQESLKAQGKTVRSTVCEHFSYSRQELFDLVKIKAIKTFDEALEAFGSGSGCETCKPVIASILASAWNDLVIKQATIQDTNDRYLANIQKGGTYSVVPRVPGGEITPDKLIMIGQIAKKYNLYCKITGGQRIDMFGAHVHQLPEIWEELTAAGFESGHAYGKSVRTVKSCVGSTWCRYGLHDSVGFAIELEERYKGLRSPHKIKMAVSGCVRECAEAQSKDIGVIATEKGWNLFVCGNGGAKPQHAVLLATDIDKETVVRYIDRLLMYYIKTAEPLTRTATWLNKLEGGIEYLKKVVVYDELAICGTLEEEMQQTLDHYYCEWKAVVENPELRRQFTHFVNSDEPDPTVEFKEERKQKFPAAWV